MAEKKSRKKSEDSDKIKKTKAAEAADDGKQTDSAGPEVENAEPAEEQTEKAVDSAEMYLDMLRRERADFENYKKRNASLASQAFSNGVCDVIEKILPALDNFDRALAGADEKDPFAVGIVMIQRQLTEALQSCGVSEIEAQGMVFDPEIMNAVMQVDAEEGLESGCVAEVLQKGYKMNDRVIRHAMVKVVK